MDFIDYKYVGLVSSRLERFKKRGNDTYNCRCPLCGDSQSNKSKTRGYILSKGDKTLYYCHNCGASMSLGNFIKTLDPTLYKEYAQERFVEKHNKIERPKEPDITSFKKPTFISGTPLNKLKKVSQLDPAHPAKMYIDSRLIPTPFHARLFYAPKFKAWVNTIVPDKFDATKDEPRLIIPFLDENGDLFAFQGRSFAKDGIRYITIILDETKPRLFGLDKLDTSKTFYVTEGPIDSMFLPNAIAMAGADLPTVLNKDNAIIVFDNEPRNKDIVKRIEKYINQGYKVCIWPEYVPYKDINEMVMSGLTTFKNIIDNNIYQGLAAKARLASWKKV